MHVELTYLREGRYSARETLHDLPLGDVWRRAEGNTVSWCAAWLVNRDAIAWHTRLLAARVELERYCESNQGEIERLSASVRASRRVAIAPEPADAEDLQAVLL